MKNVITKIALVALVATIAAPAHAISNGLAITYNSKTGTALLGAAACSALIAGTVGAATYFRRRGGSMAEGMIDFLGFGATVAAATPGALSLTAFAALSIYNSFRK